MIQVVESRRVEDVLREEDKGAGPGEALEAQEGDDNQKRTDVLTNTKLHVIAR